MKVSKNRFMNIIGLTILTFTMLFSLFMVRNVLATTLIADDFESGDFSVWTEAGGGPYTTASGSINITTNSINGSYSAFSVVRAQDNYGILLVDKTVPETMSIKSTFNVTGDLPASGGVLILIGLENKNVPITPIGCGVYNYLGNLYWAIDSLGTVIRETEPTFQSNTIYNVVMTYEVSTNTVKLYVNDELKIETNFRDLDLYYGKTCSIYIGAIAYYSISDYVAATADDFAITDDLWTPPTYSYSATLTIETNTLNLNAEANITITVLRNNVSLTNYYVNITRDGGANFATNVTGSFTDTEDETITHTYLVDDIYDAELGKQVSTFTTNEISVKWQGTTPGGTGLGGTDSTPTPEPTIFPSPSEPAPSPTETWDILSDVDWYVVIVIAFLFAIALAIVATIESMEK